MGRPTIFIFQQQLATYNREWVWRSGDAAGRGERANNTPGSCLDAALESLGHPDDAAVFISAGGKF